MQFLITNSSKNLPQTPLINTVNREFNKLLDAKGNIMGGRG